MYKRLQKAVNALFMSVFVGKILTSCEISPRMNY